MTVMETKKHLKPSTVKAVKKATKRPHHATHHIYGSFWIDQTEIALPVNSIREVVNEPNATSQLPMAPKYLLGLFNLRGMIVPIIDLRRLLEFPEAGVEDKPPHERKVAIIENGDRCVGILFDRAGEVLNEPASSRIDFAERKGGVKDTVIDGVLKLEGGDRMVQILDPYEVLNIERVPQSDATQFKTHQFGDLGNRLSCVSFQLGHTWCAFDLRFVQEVSEMLPVETSLLADGPIIGTANLRGDIIPIIDFRSFMGNEPAYKLPKDKLARRKLIVMRTSGGLIGLMVYSIDSIIPFFDRDVLAFSKPALPRGNIVKGCLVSENDQLVMLLDHDTLLADAELSGPAKLCQAVHAPDEVKIDSKQSQVAAERLTFILFTASSQFAMNTDHVSEVINRPDHLLKPPYALRFVEGIVNLRGELITLINLRTLYELEPSDLQDEKILIFSHNGRKYGILVDSVDEMVMTTADELSKDNPLGASDATRKVSPDISGAVSVTGASDEKSLVMIMGVDALVNRLVTASMENGSNLD